MAFPDYLSPHQAPSQENCVMAPITCPRITDVPTWLHGHMYATWSWWQGPYDLLFLAPAEGLTLSGSIEFNTKLDMLVLSAIPFFACLVRWSESNKSVPLATFSWERRLFNHQDGQGTILNLFYRPTTFWSCHLQWSHGFPFLLITKPQPQKLEIKSTGLIFLMRENHFSPSTHS